MKDHAAFRILCIKLFSHTCRKNNRKFQTFTLMNTHDPYRIRLFIHDPGFSVINVIFFQLFDIPHKMKQSFVACSFKRLCFFHQHLYVCGSLHSAFHRRNVYTETCFFYNLRQQIMNRSIRHFFSEMIHLTEKSHQTIFQDRILCFFRRVHPRAFMKRYVGICDSDLCHIFCQKISQRRRQNRRKREILPSVIEYFKIVKQYAHFISFKIPFPAYRICGNPFFCKDCRKILCPSFHTSCQNHNIFILHRTIFPCFFIRHNPAAHQTFNSARDHPRF